MKPAPHTENDCILFSGSSLTNCLRFRRRHLRIICHQPSTTRDSPRFIIIRQRQFCVGCCLNVKPRPSRFRPRYLPPITNEKVRRARVFPISIIRTVPLAITHLVPRTKWCDTHFSLSPAIATRVSPSVVGFHQSAKIPCSRYRWTPWFEERGQFLFAAIVKNLCTNTCCRIYISTKMAYGYMRRHSPEKHRDHRVHAGRKGK